MTIAELYTRAKTVDLGLLFEAVMIDQTSIVLALNKDQLFSFGMDRNEQRLDPYFSLTYAIQKNKRNSGPGLGFPDLYDTGAFYSGFVLSADKTGFGISSTDSKTGELVTKYGESIFGLGPTSLSEYVNNNFRPEFIDRLKNKLKK